MCFTAGFNIGNFTGNLNHTNFIVSTIYEPDKIGNEGQLTHIIPSMDSSNSGEYDRISLKFCIWQKNFIISDHGLSELQAERLHVSFYQGEINMGLIKQIITTHNLWL